MATTSKSNEIRITRGYEASVQAVWDAWTVTEQVEKWWGPRGFTLTTHSKDLRAGGSWRYTMHGPGGVDYPNVTKYFVVERHQRLVYDHGGTDDTPPLFRVTATFSELRGKTTLELVFAFATPEAAAATGKFIKQAGGYATWDRLAEHLEYTLAARSIFVINRSFDAPIAQLFAFWTQPGKLASWQPPAGSELRFLRSEIAAGKSTFFLIEGEHGRMHARFDYLALEPAERIVYTQQFVDEAEQLTSALGLENWPATLQTTVLFNEETPERTRVTVTSTPVGETTSSEAEAFVRERPNMTLGWTGSFDKLESLLEQATSSS